MAGVRTQHKDYTKMVNRWERCRDVCAGQDAIHDAGTSYLPQLEDQSNGEYDSYKCRTPFYNATWRTLVGLQGMLFRKPPKHTVPSAIEPMLKNIDLEGTPLHIFALEISEECLKLGRVGILTDFPEAAPMATQADAQRLNYRPLMRMVSAFAIINWKTQTIDNETVLSMVVIKEVADKQIDEFSSEEVDQYRVLDLLDTPYGMVYRCRLIQIQKDDKGAEIEVVVKEVFPMIKAQPLNRIPFQFIGVDEVSWVVDEPPLIDLVDMNLSHYRTSADYEHGCHFTGLPTPVVCGYDAGDKTAKFNIGSTTAWVFPRPETKVSFLEFTGQGLSALKENLSRKESYMAILGARMLESQKQTVESANTAAIHRGGEQSTLSSMAQAISIGMTKALEMFAKYGNAEGDVEFELNRDFFPVPMDALTVTAIIAAWQNQAISYETMFEKLQQGEIIPLKNTAEEEKKAITANPPPTALTDNPTTPGNVTTPRENSPKAAATDSTPAKTITQLQNNT